MRATSATPRILSAMMSIMSDGTSSSEHSGETGPTQKRSYPMPTERRLLDAAFWRMRARGGAVFAGYIPGQGTLFSHPPSHTKTTTTEAQGVFVILRSFSSLFLLDRGGFYSGLAALHWSKVNGVCMGGGVFRNLDFGLE